MALNKVRPVSILKIIRSVLVVSDCQTNTLEQCFSSAGPRPGTGPWHQLYRASRGSPGICYFSFL